MKVLSLAWKYHPSLTSGVGVACEGLNNELSKLVDLTVIYPKVSNVQVKEEIVFGSEHLSEAQSAQIQQEYDQLIREGTIELAVKLDPYFISRNYTYKNLYSKDVIKDPVRKEIGRRKTSYKKITKRLLFDEVDVFGESVRDKIFVYNRLVEELAESLSFDVIHAHDWMTFLAGIALKNKYQKPLVLHVHSLEYDRVGHKDASWVYDIERFAMSKADKVISASDYTKGIIVSNYGLSLNRIETIYNAVKLPEKPGVQPKESGDKFKVLFAGRIDGNKGIEYFIEIARLVLQELNNVEFLIVGRGFGNVKLEEIDGFHEVESSVTYLGFVERETLFELYDTCDVLCMPSISEPFGLTAIEAAYVGLPVVLSKKTGASEILKRTPMARFWDTQRLANHVIAILQNDKTRRRIIASNKRDVAKLSWKTSAKRVVGIYKDLIRG
ncbi:MAG: glycosyltransferase [Cytophagales bacterium]|nr:glycosyltransferase [Cytophagales bacterium]